jgi:heme/copper-type cytochrome/quinol oxidase subunit 4
MIRFANASKVHKMQMRIYGTMCAISGISLFAIYLANRNAYGHGKADLYIVEYAIAFLVLAAGLLAARVWAELIFNLCLLCVSIGLVASLVMNRETDISQISLDLFVIALLMTPVALSIQRLKHGAYFLRGA